MPPYKPIAERFAAKFTKGSPDECWEWQGATVRGGYGALGGERAKGRVPNVSAHCFAYEQANGPIPEGMLVLHECDNPSCVNPRHLFLGTHADNMKDMARKGRARVLTEDQAREVVALTATMSQAAIGRRFGVAHSTIQQVLKRASVSDFGGSQVANLDGKYQRLTEDEKRAIFALLNEGASILSIATRIGVDRKTVRNLRDK